MCGMKWIERFGNEQMCGKFHVKINHTHINKNIITLKLMIALRVAKCSTTHDHVK